MQVNLEALTSAFQKSLNQEAYDYLQERGISEESIEQFRIGFDPGEIGFSYRQDANLLDHYFEHRVVFPIRNRDQEIVDLIGRALDRREPKYKTLFGEDSTFFNEVVLGQAEDIVFCQSIIDVITLHQAGVAAICLANAMLFKDTHAKALEGQRMIICMGNDELGRREGTRISEQMEAAGISGVVMQLPEGVRDVNDFFLRVEDPLATFVQLIAQALEEQMVSPMTPDARHLTAYTEEYSKRLKQEDAHWWSSGYDVLDETLGGGVRQGFYLISGTSEAGKTALMKSIADEIALQETPVLFLSWDLTGFELWQYSIARILELPVQTLQRGMVEVELVSEANKAYHAIAGMLWTMEGKLETSADDMNSMVEHIVRSTGQPPVIFVDQMLRLINPTLDPYSPSALITLGYVMKTWSQLWDTAVFASLPLPHSGWSVPAPLLGTSDFAAEVSRRPVGGWRLQIHKNRAGIRGDLELN